MHSDSSVLVQEFRSAVSAGEFARAQDLWNEYAAARVLEAQCGCGDNLPEAHALLEWTRTVATCWRAQALHTLRSQLTQARAAAAYDNRNSIPR
jgi:hypothetical protein